MWRDIWKKYKDTIEDFRSEGTTTGADVAVLERKPSHPSKLLSAIDTNIMEADSIAEYRRVCEEAGVDEKDIVVEEFRAFLAKHDLPTFNLREVIAYMDDLTKRDNPAKLGWHWCPVRPKDTAIPMRFGTPSTEYSRQREAASDYYSSHNFSGRYAGEGMSYGAEYGYWLPPLRDIRQHASPHYTRTLPIHALKKIALIEKEWKGPQVVFLVTDYTTQPHIVVNPDPFLMAVVPNSAVAHGKGRFVIDVWDEPGFGIDKMLK